MPTVLIYRQPIKENDRENDMNHKKYAEQLKIPDKNSTFEELRTEHRPEWKSHIRPEMVASANILSQVADQIFNEKITAN